MMSAGPWSAFHCLTWCAASQRRSTARFLPLLRSSNRPINNNQHHNAAANDPAKCVISASSYSPCRSSDVCVFVGRDSYHSNHYLREIIDSTDSIPTEGHIGQVMVRLCRLFGRGDPIDRWHLINGNPCNTREGPTLATRLGDGSSTAVC